MTEKKKESGGLSRRDFLKDAGLVVGGAAVGSVALLAACAPSEATKTVTTTETKTVEVPMTFPASQGYLVVDTKKCASCQTCMLACSLVHEGVENVSLSRIQILQNSFGHFPDDIEIAQCRQCVNPLCVQACAVGACYVDTANGNVRVIDESKCIGCKLCIDACPFIPHRTIWNDEKNVAMKCDLCADTPYWSEAGGPNGKQACVETCIMQAIELVKAVPSQLDNDGYDVNLRTARYDYLLMGEGSKLLQQR